MKDHVSSKEAAALIGCTMGRIRQLCRAGTLKGERVGRDWIVLKSSAEAYRDSAKRKRGPKGPRGKKGKGKK